MSEEKAKQPRPPQVAVASAIVMLGSVVVILLMWDRIAHLHDLDSRRSLQDFLDSSKLDDEGVSLHGLLTTVQVLSMVCAAGAVAMAVQGWQAFQGSRSARVALSVVAVPLFACGLVGDGIVGSAAATFWCTTVAAGVATMWMGPNRVWFGDPPPAPRPQAPPPPHLRAWTDPDRVQPPPATSPFGTPAGPGATSYPPTLPAAAPPPWQAPPTSVYDARRSPTARPRALLWACALTWVSTGIAAVGLVLSLVAMSTNSGSALDDVYRRNPQLADHGLSRHAVLVTLIVLSAIVLVAALAAAAFALLVFLRRRWAWYALVGCASAATLLFVIGSIGTPVSFVMLGASLATIACLVRPEVRAWLLLRR
ncbi:MAG: hypothetical protein QM747_08085 [Nocardioides sp.]